MFDSKFARILFDLMVVLGALTMWAIFVGFLLMM
jgi:hypothetical protein